MTTEAPPPEPFHIFNRRRTVGVAAAHGGAVTGIYLGEDVRTMSERDLAREILAVAAVAAMRGRLSVRERLQEGAAATDCPVPPGTFELLPTVPTAPEYEAFRQKMLRY